jgi:hypothetical protein
MAACEPPTALPPVQVASCAVTPTSPSLAVGDTGGVWDVDEMTGTMQLTLTILHEESDAWEHTFERGFTRASAAGSHVARATEPWC